MEREDSDPGPATLNPAPDIAARSETPAAVVRRAPTPAIVAHPASARPGPAETPVVRRASPTPANVARPALAAAAAAVTAATASAAAATARSPPPSVGRRVSPGQPRLAIPVKPNYVPTTVPSFEYTGYEVDVYAKKLVQVAESEPVSDTPTYSLMLRHLDALRRKISEMDAKDFDIDRRDINRVDINRGDIDELMELAQHLTDDLGALRA